MSGRGSGELVRPRGQVAIAVGDPGSGVRRPADGNAFVADGDVGVVVLGLRELCELVDERDRAGEAVEAELALERAVALAPSLGNAHPAKYGAFRRSVKGGPTRELLCDWVYRPLAHLVVRALLPLRLPPPAVVLAAAAAGLAAALEIARGEFRLAAGLVILKTILDNADGQLARASSRVTALGRYLDSESDLLVNASLVAALGYATSSPLLALSSFVVLTLVLSANFNLRRLYERERGLAADAMPPATGAAAALRRIYAIVYAPQDRLVERLVQRRLRRFDGSPAARLAYHDHASIALLHNLGLSGQMSALALCLAIGRPQLEFWIVLACGLALVPLELRRGLRAARTDPLITNERRQAC